MPKPFSKPRGTSSSAPGSERSFTVTVKSLRNPPLDLRLTSQEPNTSILDIKAAVAEQAGLAPNKIKILHKKKPVLESKVLKDLAGEGETTIELSIMVLGGAAATVASKVSGAEAEVAQGASGSQELETKEFWDDLKGFLLQRLRDEKQAEELFDTFEGAWKAKR
jgi:ubiquitin-like protein 4